MPGGFDRDTNEDGTPYFSRASTKLVAGDHDCRSVAGLLPWTSMLSWLSLFQKNSIFCWRMDPWIPTPRPPTGTRSLDPRNGSVWAVSFGRPRVPSNAASPPWLPPLWWLFYRLFLIWATGGGVPRTVCHKGATKTVDFFWVFFFQKQSGFKFWCFFFAGGTWKCWPLSPLPSYCQVRSQKSCCINSYYNYNSL